MNLEEMIDVFLSNKIETTRRSYLYCLRDMSGYIGPNRPLPAIDTLDMLKYFAEVKSRDYKPATVHKYIKTAKAFFNWCVKLKFIPEAPTKNIENVKLPQSIDRNKAMTNSEFERVVEYLTFQAKFAPQQSEGFHRHRNLAIFLFLADTGCRAGGLSGLTIDRLYLDDNAASVIEKGDKPRMVYYGDKCKEVIEKWIEEKSKYERNGVYVFSGTEKPLSVPAISQMIRRTARRAGVKHVGSAHSLRHRKAFVMAEAQVSPKVVQHMLGHADVKTTVTHYYDVNQEIIKREAQKLAYSDGASTDRKPDISILNKDNEKRSS